MSLERFCRKEIAGCPGGHHDQVAFSMREHGIRRLPIVDAEGRLCGLVAFDDLVVLLAAELGQTTAALQQNRGP